MRIFETYDGLDAPINILSSGDNYSKERGANHLHNLFNRVRATGLVEPYRAFDRDYQRWYISANNWYGFWVTLEEAETLEFEELMVNLGKCVERKWREQSHR